MNILLILTSRGNTKKPNKYYTGRDSFKEIFSECRFDGDPIPFNYFGLGFAWTPDGYAVTFIAERDGSQNVWQMPLDGGPAKQLTDFNGSQIRWFDWTRDGHQLLCVLASDTSVINNTK